MCNGGARTVSQAAFLITVRLSELLNQLPVSMSNWTISTSSRPTWLSHHFYLAICTLNKTLQPGHVPWVAPPWRRHCIWGVGAERPRTWGGSSLNLGRNDRVCLRRTWGGSTRGGSTEGRIDRYPTGITWHMTFFSWCYCFPELSGERAVLFIDRCALTPAASTPVLARQRNSRSRSCWTLN